MTLELTENEFEDLRQALRDAREKLSDEIFDAENQDEDEDEIIVPLKACLSRLEAIAKRFD